MPWKYLDTFKYPITKLRCCTPIQILKHLRDEHGAIISQYLTNNTTRMTAQWNYPTSIEYLFLQIRDGQ